MSSDGTHYNHDPLRDQYPPTSQPPEATCSSQSSSNPLFHHIISEPSSAVLRDSSHSYPPPSGGPGGFALPNHSNDALNAQYPQGNLYLFLESGQSKLSQNARPPLQHSQDSSSQGQSSQIAPPSSPETAVLVTPESSNSYGRPVPEDEKESYRPLQPEQPAVRPSYQIHCNNRAIFGVSIFDFLVLGILIIAGIVMMVCSKVIKEHCYSVCGIVETDSNNCDSPNCHTGNLDMLFFAGMMAIILGASSIIIVLAASVTKRFFRTKNQSNILEE